MSRVQERGQAQALCEGEGLKRSDGERQSHAGPDPARKMETDVHPIWVSLAVTVDGTLGCTVLQQRLAELMTQLK